MDLAYGFTAVTTMPMLATHTTKMAATTRATKATRTTTTMTNIMIKVLLASNNIIRVTGRGDVARTRKKTPRPSVTSQ